MATTDRAKPSSARPVDALAHDVISASRAPICAPSKRCFANGGAQQRFKTITADNGTEFHDYEQLERGTGVAFYFATPHHSWERGTNETPTA